MLGRRGSTSVGGVLAAPELEILPLAAENRMDFKAVVDESAMENRKRERETRMTTSRYLNFSEGGSAKTLGCSDGVRDDDDNGAADDVDLSHRRDHGDETESIKSSATSETIVVSSEYREKEETKKAKFGTWSGFERKVSARHQLVRQSTLDFAEHLREMEKRERENVLRAADAVLNRSRSRQFD
jgi:hypothetical protein